MVPGIAAPKEEPRFGDASGSRPAVARGSLTARRSRRSEHPAQTRADLQQPGEWTRRALRVADEREQEHVPARVTTEPATISVLAGTFWRDARRKGRKRGSARRRAADEVHHSLGHRAGSNTRRTRSVPAGRDGRLPVHKSELHHASAAGRVRPARGQGRGRHRWRPCVPRRLTRGSVVSET